LAIERESLRRERNAEAPLTESEIADIADIAEKQVLENWR
jgi:hypothetical protein